MPRLVGRNLSAARRLLGNAGIGLEIVREYSGRRPGTVLRQAPALSEIEEGGSVRLFVAQSYPRVPNLVGKALKDVRRILDRAGFRVEFRRQVSSSPKDTVLSQQPGAGARVRPGRTVNLTVAKPAPVSSGPSNCDPSYPDVCIPRYPPDLDCGEIGYTNFRVVGSDPHGFDGDNDGVGCET